MTKNFFYIEGVEKEERIKKKLDEKVSIEETPLGGDKKVLLPIRRRTAVKQSNFPRKIFVLEEIEIPEIIEQFLFGYPRSKIELRFGYYIMDRKGNWKWGQFAPFIPKKDLKDLIEKAKEHGFI